MRVPDKFPPGCEFCTNGDAIECVKFPDGRVFVLDEETGLLRLTSARDLPMSPGCNRSSEESLRATAAAAAKEAEFTQHIQDVQKTTDAEVAALFTKQQTAAEAAAAAEKRLATIQAQAQKFAASLAG